ncbi:hypothetical protein ACWEV9_21340 [Streptomyces albogriseolus]|uniref:hypothetical protein n=1 Tax=Streptomyces albogriseolus TaxID=1887 RepID=UPI003812D4E4
MVSGNATLAARYIAHFQDQVKHAGDSLHTTYDHTTSDPDAPVEAFFFPRDTSSDASHYGNADIVASFVDDVDCARDGRIRISAAELDERSSRPAIYTALAAKRAAGCAVEINGRDLSDPNGDGDNAGVNELTGLDIPVYANRPGVARKVANTLTDGRQTRPAVAVTGDGRIVAVWADEYTTGSGTVVRQERVYHRTFSAAGAPGGAEARTTPDSAEVPGGRPIGPQTDPDVAVSDAGDFVVAWKEAFVDGLDDVWARGHNADGSTTGRLPALRMNVVSGGGQGGPAVTLAPGGRLSLTYSDDCAGNQFNEMRLRDAFANR